MHRLQWHTRFARPLLLAVIMGGAFSTTALAEDIVRVGGAGSGLGVIKILARTFEKKYPGTTIKVLPNLGSSGGIKALLHGALDIAISGRPLNAEEVKSGAAAVECARTPFVFIAHNGVNKADISVRELEQIYRGQLLKWSDGKRIRLILRPAGDTDTAIVKSISKDMEQAVTAALARPEMIMAVTDQEAADDVAKIPGALSGTTLMQINTESPRVKVLSFNGVKPTLDALARGSYPLAKPLYLVTAPNASVSAVRFITFARSAKGCALLKKSGALTTSGNMRTK